MPDPRANHQPPITHHQSPRSPGDRSCPLPPSSLQPPASSLPRRGISLVEVLISMFVLLVGLMGVAALIPAGRHEILQGAKVDHATAVGRAAYRELKIRGYLNPARWVESGGGNVFVPATGLFTGTAQTNSGNEFTPAVAIDPLGLTAPVTPYPPEFPYNPSASALLLTRIYPDFQISSLATDEQKRALSDIIFRNADDLLFTPQDAADAPAQQSVYVEHGSGVAVEAMSEVIEHGGGETPLKRASVGDYSWLATIVTDPTASALSSKVIVSVAVFYKRDLSDPAATERVARVVDFPGSGIGGGEVQIQYQAGPVDKPLRPGTWIMLAGSLPHPTLPPPNTLAYFRWYRVVAADVLTDAGGVVQTNKALNDHQYVTLAGADWNPNTTNTEAWLFDGVVAVYEKTMMLDRQ